MDRPRPRRGAAARPADRAAQPAVAAGAHLDARSTTPNASARRVRPDADRPRPVPLGQRHPRPPRGDRLLLQIADRLRLALPRGAEAARLGGDEFAVLLPVADSTTRAQRVARTLVAALSSPLDLDGLTLVLEASAGRRRLPRPRHDAEGLLRRADVAMYQAKRDRTRRRGLRVQAGLQHPRPARPARRPAPRAGRARGAAALPAQGPLRRPGGRPGGAGALGAPRARAGSPPDEFIAIAESVRADAAAHRVRAGDRARPGRPRGGRRACACPVAVNVSPRDVHTPGFAGAVAARLARHGVPAGRAAAGDHRARAAGGPAAGRRHPGRARPGTA